jgi:dipeptidyl aminopeptidase/acylaminoacyl peptidase
MMRASLSFLFVVCCAAAQTPTIEQSLNLKTAGGAVISPDGRFVAYTENDANWEENDFVSQVWIATVATGERFQLTRGKKSSGQPRWEPNGKRLAFASERDGKRQIYLISPTGGEAVQLTNVDTGVAAFEWAPDGASIAYVSSGPEDKAIKDRKDKYGDFEVVNGDYVMSHIWLIKVSAEIASMPKAEQLTKGKDFTVNEIAWSPDSSRIAFGATRDPDLSSGDTASIWVVRLADKYVKRLVDTAGPDRNPVWSPNGREIAFVSAGGKQYHYYLNSHIAVVPADGGKPRLLGEDFDEDPRLDNWGPAGIYFEALQRTSAYLFRVDPVSGRVEKDGGGAGTTVGGVTFTKDFRTAAFSCGGANKIGEICVSALKPFEPRAVTDMAAQYKDFKLARREVTEWKSKDGTTIEGVLIKPADFDPSRKYPLLVVIHGGPTGISMPGIAPDRYYPVEMFAAKGAIILQPNYRGSAGYGEKFRSLNVRNLGLGDYDDVITGVDALIAKGYIDRNRIGTMGWSQGGYISAFIATYSDRFKAASVGAGISNWTTYYVNTDIHPFTRQYLKATPWDDPEIYRKTSPISYVSQAKTPTLIQHGENDKRVPIPNAYELYQALEDKGVPVKLIVYKGFGHGITKPKQQRAVMEHNYEWFSKWIWGEKPAEPTASGGQIGLLVVVTQFPSKVIEHAQLVAVQIGNRELAQVPRFIFGLGEDLRASIAPAVV